jgi:hypothetical protein
MQAWVLAIGIVQPNHSADCQAVLGKAPVYPLQAGQRTEAPYPPLVSQHSLWRQNGRSQSENEGLEVLQSFHSSRPRG